MRVKPVAGSMALAGVAILQGAAALAAPPPRELLTPTWVVHQLPSGEVLLLEAPFGRLSHWDGGSLQPLATFRPPPCQPNAFAWDGVGQRLAVVCPFRLEGRLLRYQELHELKPGGQIRSLDPPPLIYTWALAWRDSELHAAGVPCPTRRCPTGMPLHLWKREHLGSPRPAWWRRSRRPRGWQEVRSVEVPAPWPALLPDAPGGGDQLADGSAIASAFDAAAGVFAPTAGGRWWFVAGAAGPLQLLSPGLAPLAQFPSPLPAPGWRQLGPSRGRPGARVMVRSLVGATVAGETLVLLAAGEDGQELLTVSEGGEVVSRTLPAGQCWPQMVEGVLEPLPCQMAVGEEWVLLGAPWQLFPLPPAAATPAP